MKKVISLFLSVLMLLSFTVGMNLSVFATDYQGVETQASDLTTGDTFQMGMYPQSEVTDADLMTALGNIDCTMKSYGYLKKNGTVDMTYADIVYNDEVYRKVYIGENRPFYTTETPSRSHQIINGYNAEQIYYFKWEPVVWRVLAKEDDGVYVVSEALLDSQAYNNVYDSIAWENCTLRAWLNGDFYTAAFSDGEKDKILFYTHENKGFPSYGEQDGNDTTDKLWLLSYSDAINTGYGFSSDPAEHDEARIAQGTDYAKSQGIWVNTKSEYLGNSEWWLRSPCGDSGNKLGVDGVGYLDVNYTFYNVHLADMGIRPAFKLDLNATVSDSDSSVCDVLGHDWGEWVSDNNATYDADGTKTRKCINCGESETVTDVGTKKTKPADSDSGNNGNSTNTDSTVGADTIRPQDGATATNVGDGNLGVPQSTVGAVIGRPQLKVKAAKKSAKLSWSKVDGAQYYEIQYGTNKKFKKAKKKKVKASKTSVTLKKLKKGKKYYFRIRAVSGSTKSAWSKKKSVKVK